MFIKFSITFINNKKILINYLVTFIVIKIIITNINIIIIKLKKLPGAHYQTQGVDVF